MFFQTETTPSFLSIFQVCWQTKFKLAVTLIYFFLIILFLTTVNTFSFYNQGCH